MSAEPGPVCRPIDGASAAARRDEAQCWRDGAEVHIDVRGLVPPQPLVAILRLVQTAAAETAIVVHHDRDPVLLYPELAELGWGATRIAGPDSEVRLLLRRLP